MAKKLIILALLPLFLASCKKHDPEEQGRIDEDIILQYIEDNNLTQTALPTGSGLYYVIENEGTGANPTINSTVTVDYRGYYTDGGTFDESSNAGATFALTGVIAGWQEGIPLFKEGGNGILLIPSALGYGQNGSGSIPPNTVIVFDVELLDVQ